MPQETAQKTASVFFDKNNDRKNILQGRTKEIADANQNPFSKQNLEKNPNLKKIKETDYWILVENMKPSSELKKHFLIISKQFIRDVDNMPRTARIELFDLEKIVTEKYKLCGGRLVVPFGKTKNSGALLRQAHAEIEVF